MEGFIHSILMSEVKDMETQVLSVLEKTSNLKNFEISS